MDLDVLDKIYEGLDTNIQTNVIVGCGKAKFYNVKTEQTSSKVERLLSEEDFKSENYIVLQRSEFKHKRLPVVIVRQKDDINFVIFKVLNTEGTLEKYGPKFNTESVYAFTKDKGCYYYSQIRYYDGNKRKAVNHFIDMKLSWDDLKSYLKEKFNVTSIYCDTPIFSAQFRKPVAFVEDKNEISFLKKLAAIYGDNIKTISSNRIIDITSGISEFMQYINYKEPVRKLGKEMQKLADMSLPDIDKSKVNMDDKIFGYVQYINEKMCVLRVIKNDNGELIDINKTFITKTKISSIKRTDAGNFALANTKSLSNWEFKIYNVDDPSLDKTVFRFAEDVYKSVRNEDYTKILLFTVTNPIIEQLYKSPFKPICEYMLKDTRFTNAGRLITKFFGVPSEKGGVKGLGFNKHQIKKIVDVINKDGKDYEILYKLPSLIKTVVSNTTTDNYWEPLTCFAPEYVDVSPIDDKTFDEMVDNIVDIIKYLKKSHCRWRYSEDEMLYYYKLMLCAIKLYPTNQVIKMLELISKVIKASENECDTDRTLRFYFDFLGMVKEIKDTGELANIRVIFSGDNLKEQIIHAHNEIVELRRVMELEIQAKRLEAQETNFSINTKKCEKYEYEGENFVAIIPKKAVELVVEGIELHHCVGSYVGRVASGVTNIMFIRKSSDLEKPFFTVEISKTGVIEQIHGSCNCCVEEDSDLEKFVKEWVSKKHLKLNNINKVR